MADRSMARPCRRRRRQGGQRMCGAAPQDAALAQALCADEQGFSLYTAMRCAADERQRLEQLCRVHIPSSAGQRTRAMRRRRAGGAQAEDTLARRPHVHRDVAAGFMQRLAALVPRLHLIRFHGVLAPNAKLRARVVPDGPEEAKGES